jgi:hypothetical protein
VLFCVKSPVCSVRGGDARAGLYLQAADNLTSIYQLSLLSSSSCAVQVLEKHSNSRC